MPAPSTPTPPASCSSAWVASPASALPHRPGKAYEAEVVLGTATSTLDAAGEIVGHLGHGRASPWTTCGRRPPRSPGSSSRSPPWCRPCKVDGRRLHELARAGHRGRARRPPGHGGPLRCPRAGRRARRVPRRGRVLVGDLRPGPGRRSGGDARGRGPPAQPAPHPCGSFGLDEASARELTAEHVLSPAQALRDLSQVEVIDEVSRSVSHGLALDRVSVGATGDGPWALVDRPARCWRSTRPPTPTGWWRRASWPPPDDRTGRRHRPGRTRTGRRTPTGNLGAMEVVVGPEHCTPPAGGRRSPSAPMTACTWATATCFASCGAWRPSAVSTAWWSPSTATPPRWCGPHRRRRCSPTSSRSSSCWRRPGSTAPWWCPSTRPGPRRRPRTS